jgi:hypothetical protein
MMPDYRELAAAVDGGKVKKALDIARLRKDWETDDYGCSFEDFCKWWLGEDVSPEVQKRADAESFRINLEHARKLDEEDMARRRGHPI